MKGAIHICFPDLSDPISRTTVELPSESIAASVKNTVIVHYHLSAIRIDTPEETRAKVTIKTTGLYLFILETGSFTVERTGAKDIHVPAAEDYCRALYLHTGDSFLLFPGGKHRLICFFADAAWIHRLQQSLPVMTEVSAGMLPPKRAIIFPRYKLPETFSRDMVTLAYQSETAILAEQLVHFHALDYILVHYDSLLVRTRQANAVRKNYTEIVEAFIREGRRHLCRGSLLRVENLAALIGIRPTKYIFPD